MKSAWDLRLKSARPSAFTAPIKYPELWYISPPTRHLCALATGGLKKLYDNIRDRKVISGNRRPSIAVVEPKSASDNVSCSSDNQYFVPWASMPLLAGRYLYLDVVARGRASVIISARDTYCNSVLVVIKVFHADNFLVGGQEADILRYIEATNSPKSVPVVRLLNIFRLDAHYSLVFEALSPCALTDRFKRRGWVGNNGLPYIHKVARQVLDALCFIHERKVIHADVKCDNILLLCDDVDADVLDVRLIDFGNSFRFTAEEVAAYEDDYELQTLIYRAPEVMLGFGLDFALDLWSVGCILAELYLGRPLFFGDTKAEVLRQMTKRLGPLPMEMQAGKFAAEFQSNFGVSFSHKETVDRLSRHLDCANHEFMKFLASLLTLKPDERLTAQHATCHSFIAQNYSS